MKLAKWGNSFAVRVPAALVKELGLKEGDEVALRPGAPNELLVERKLDTREAAIQVLRKHRGQVPADFKFDRNEIYDRR